MCYALYPSHSRLSTFVDNQVPLDDIILLRLVEFLGQLVPLIRTLREANIDLCVFCRNNNEPFEMYTSHKVSQCFIISTSLICLMLILVCNAYSRVVLNNAVKLGPSIRLHYLLTR